MFKVAITMYVFVVSYAILSVLLDWPTRSQFWLVFSVVSMVISVVDPMKRFIPRNFYIVAYQWLHGPVEVGLDQVAFFRASIDALFPFYLALLFAVMLLAVRPIVQENRCD